MNKSLLILLMFFLLLSFAGCEKVIEIDLSNAQEAIVIEAIVTNGKAPFTVRISKTSPYFGVKSDNLVSGATVSMRVEKGKPKYFYEISPGLYTLEKTIALPNFWYIVDIEYEGITYSARSFMNETVPIVDFGFSYFDGFGFFDSGYKISSYIKDPLGVENYYRLKYYLNGKAVDDKGEISLYSDKLFDGKSIGLGQRTAVFQEADTLVVELQSIDKAAYDYFSTLENITGTDMVQSASPANPISNFNNGALGYFSAYSYDRRKIVIKDYLPKN